VYPVEPLPILDELDDIPRPAPRLVPGRDSRLLLRGETVIEHLAIADSPLRRMRGLLGRSELPRGEGLWISPCNAIHMLFMRFAIDAVFVDEHLQVVRVCEDLRPWRLARGGKFAHSVLELPTGTAAFFNLRVGDRLQVVGPAPVT